MSFKTLKPLTCLVLLFAGSASLAQAPAPETLRRSIDILSGVLHQGLGLEDSPGLFGINQGMVSGVYLHGQGAVLEIRSPLATKRNRISLGSLASSLENMQFGNPFDMIVLRAEPGPPETMAFVWRDGGGDDVSRELLDHINSVDESAAISSTLRQGNLALRSLQELGSLDESRLAGIHEEMDRLRRDLADSQQGLQALQARVREQADRIRGADAAGARVQIEEELAALRMKMGQLREAATGSVSELQSLNSQARERYSAQWRSDVESLEGNLYQLLCDYGASLRELPDGEFVTVVLKGLGEASDQRMQPDRIHVVAKRDLQRCQSGDLDVAGLRQQATVYSY